MSQLYTYDVSAKMIVHRCDACGLVYGIPPTGPQVCPGCCQRQRDDARRQRDDLSVELRGKLTRARATIRRLRQGATR